MRHAIIAIAIVCAATAAPGAFAQSMGAGTRVAPGENPDAMFVQQAGRSGEAEVELSRIAVQQASSGAVRHLAESLVEQHERNNRELMTIAAHENISPPRELDAEHAELRAQLSVIHGEEFDHAYLRTVLADQAKLALLLRSAQGTVSTPELRQYIATTLPLVQDQLNMARSVRFE
jgi:putative membrane protein